MEHPIERLSRYSSSPEPPSKPIGDFYVFSIRIARYVTSDLSPATIVLVMFWDEFKILSQWASKATLSFGFSQTNAAILIASGSS